jgi:quercetin dioxygenase-like cupin family protein
MRGITMGQNIVHVAPGITRQIVIDGEKLMQVKFTLQAGSKVPSHTHPHEQAPLVLQGRLQFILDGKEHLLGPGDCLLCLANQEHSALALEDTVVVDTFSPPREDFR